MTAHRIGPETNRIIHRAFTLDDAEAFHRLNGDPDVMRYTGEPPLTSLDDARRAITDYPDFDTVGYGRWACVLKETGNVIGFCGLKYLDDLNEVDVGFRFFPEHWGKGLATETCTASLTFGFDVLQTRPHHRPRAPRQHSLDPRPRQVRPDEVRRTDVRRRTRAEVRDRSRTT